MNCENCGEQVTRAKLVGQQWFCGQCAAITAEIAKRENLGPLTYQSVDARAIHPSQVADAREHWSKIGKGIVWRDDGTVEFSSRKARARMFGHASELMGRTICDRDGGYGDDPRT